MRLLVLRLLYVAFAGCVVSAAAQAGGSDPSVRAAYGNLSLSLPSPTVVTVCHGFGCRDRTEVSLSGADRAHMAQLLHGGQSSPAAERSAIAATVAWFDRRVGVQAGTQHHVARAGLGQMSDASSQFDCIDTSRNTTSLLLVLDDLKLLKHHRVEQPVARGALLDGRWPHATAVIGELGSDKEWAVDSWTHAWGERPDIIPLPQWLQSAH